MHETQPRFYAVGDKVPKTGVYRVFHGAGPLVDEVTLVQNETFPRCAVCKGNVHFSLVKLVSWDGHDLSFRIRLYEVPHPCEEEGAAGELK